MRKKQVFFIILLLMSIMTLKVRSENKKKAKNPPPIVKATINLEATIPKKTIIERTDEETFKKINQTHLEPQITPGFKIKVWERSRNYI